jgi:hypothetical protein
MVNLPSIASLAGGFLSQVPLGSWNPAANAPATPSPSSQLHYFSSAPSCPIDGPMSCHNTTVAPDSCCFIYPGGQLLQTQFWDTSPAVGPEDSWTLHGLWYAYIPTSQSITLSPFSILASSPLSIQNSSRKKTPLTPQISQA